MLTLRNACLWSDVPQFNVRGSRAKKNLTRLIGNRTTKIGVIDVIQPLDIYHDQLQSTAWNQFYQT